MGDFDFLEPLPRTVMTVDLPSRGVVYPKGSPQAAGKITMSPMTMVEETMILNQSGKDGGDVIDKVIQRCIQERFDINTLLAADKFFLFMMLRAITYGPEYTFEWTCPARDVDGVCNTKNRKTVRIPDDFMVKRLADEDVEPFELVLPDCQKKISFRLLRGFDEGAIEEYTKGLDEQRKAGISVPDTTVAYRLSRHIQAVDGKSLKEAPEDKVVRFIASLSAGDGRFLREKINYFTPGIETIVDLKCRECGTPRRVPLPISSEFFRPTPEIAGNPVGDEVRADVPSGVIPPRPDADGSRRA